MKSMSFLTAMMAGAAIAAAPKATVTSVSQDAATRIVTVNYTLSDGPAIVTPDVLTNGVTIGLGRIRAVWGDVNRVVTQPDEGTLKFQWYVDRDWPGHLVNDFQVELTAWPASGGPEYMVVSLHVPNFVRYYRHEKQMPDGPITNDNNRTSNLVLKRVDAAGSIFKMGSVVGETGREPASTRIATDSSTGSEAKGYGPNGVIGKETLHDVHLTKNFYLGVFPVTQRQCELMLTSGYGSAQDWGSSGCLPIERPSWWGPQHYGQINAYKLRPLEYSSYNLLMTAANKIPETSFMACLKAFTGVTGFDLPTEAEWEFACRAGSTGAVPSGLELAGETSCTQVNTYARYARNGGTSDGTENDRARDTHYGRNTPAVGLYKANAWGFYDMLGCVWEMCRDTYVADLGSAAVTDPCATAGDTAKVVVRGGAYNEDAAACRCAARAGLPKDTAYRGAGLRLCVEF